VVRPSPDLVIPFLRQHASAGTVSFPLDSPHPRARRAQLTRQCKLPNLEWLEWIAYWRDLASGETLDNKRPIVQPDRFIPYTPPSTGDRAHAGGYAAHFVEVQVDPLLGSLTLQKSPSSTQRCAIRRRRRGNRLR